MKDREIFSRRRFLAFCASTLFWLEWGSWPQLASAAKAGESGLLHPVKKSRGKLQVDALRQLITADSSQSRFLMCQSDRLYAGMYVEYRLPGAADAWRAEVSYDYFTDRDFSCYFYQTMLRGLQPKLTYEYRFFCDGYATEWKTLQTAGSGAFKALLFPDSQCVDYGCWGNLAQAAFRRNPDAGFFVNLGDLVDNGEAPWQWDAWLDGAAGIIDRIPLAAVMGNHEAYSLEWQYCLPKLFLHMFSFPDNQSQRFPGYYYSFDYGAVHFIVLNTQFEEIDGLQPGLEKEQLLWLEADRKKSRKKWNIVLMHRDIFTYEPDPKTGKYGGFSDIGKLFMPVFDSMEIDLVLTGHLHTYRNRGHIYNFAPAKKGPVYIVSGVAGDVRYPDIWIDPAFDHVVAPQPETDNYMTLEVDEHRLLIRSFLPDGREIARMELT